MKFSVVLALSLCLTAVGAIVHPDYAVTYSGGSLQSVKSGQSLRLILTAESVVLYRDKIHSGEPEFRVKASAITEITYGQEAHHRTGAAIATSIVAPRIAILLAMSQTKKHYIGLTWNDGQTSGGMVLQADKNDFRGLLAALEGMTARRAVNTDADPANNGPMTTVQHQGAQQQESNAASPSPEVSSGSLISVFVQSSPADAFVEVDGYPVGKTPVDVKLGKGEYTLKVSKSGFQTWSQKLTVEPGKAQSLGLALAATAARTALGVPAPPQPVMPPRQRDEGETGIITLPPAVPPPPAKTNQ